MAKEQKLRTTSHFRKTSLVSLSSLSSVGSIARESPRRKSSTTPLKSNVLTATEQANERERSKLVFVEAQRIIAVVDDALLSLKVIARIASLCENHDYFENFLGKEISTAVVHLCTALSHPYETQERGEVKRLSSLDSTAVEKLKKMSREQKLAAYSSPSLRRIRDLVKKIIRLLLQKRSLFNMVCGDSVPSPSLMGFTRRLGELRRFVYEKLTMSDEDDKQEIKYYQEAPSREEEDVKEINELEEELNKVKVEAAQEVRALKDKIAILEDDIEKMVTISAEAILQKRMDALGEIEYEERLSKAERISLEVELVELRSQFMKEMKQNRDSELNLRRRNFKLGTEVENWIEKYDHDMDDRLARYEQVNEEYLKEKAELTKLEAEFAPIQKAYNALMEERAEKERSRQLQIEKDAHIYKAAVTLQKYFRRFLAICLLTRLKAKAAKGKRKQKQK